VITFYATLADARLAARATTTSDDDILIRNLRAVSQRVDLLMGKPSFFAPVFATRKYAISPLRLSSLKNTLILPDHVLELVEVKVDDEDITSDVSLYSDAPTNELKLDKARTWRELLGDEYPTFCEIRAWFGYVSDYPRAWQTIDTLNVALSATTTTFAIAEAATVNARTQVANISPGALLRINDECMHVVSLTGTSTRVLRGVNGTTAAPHAIGASIKLFHPDFVLREVVARQAAFKYARRGSYENAQITDLTTTQYPPDLLQELRGVLSAYAYR